MSAPLTPSSHKRSSVVSVERPLVLYCTSSYLHSRLRRTLSAYALQIAASWEQVAQFLSGAHCCVLATEALERGSTLSQIHLLKRHHPDRPVVLVTRKAADNAAHLKGLVIEEVVWIRDVEADLRPAVERASRSYPVLARLGAAFETALHLSPRLRIALTIACRSDQPVPSVNELVRLAGCSRATLWRDWSSHLADGRLQDFLHWIMLLRGVAQKTPGTSWNRVARERACTSTPWRAGQRICLACGCASLPPGRSSSVVRRPPAS